ncbi:uncharacterized protein LOC129953880 [Eupeodes corollae]|uniref:uncharacterized protein LOC129953880 n=1 Tax=Eupeodes corollae TaxID=290404 RepID=UPI002492D8F6|nr:uncharacterized protein LOC129953880 [Eupeodes corollae]
MPNNDQETPPMDVTIMTGLVSSINALKAAVEELRKDTAESQTAIKDLSIQVEALPIQNRDSLDTSADHFSTPLVGNNLLIPAGNLTNTRIYDLPTFSGNAEEWPLFFASFEDTTEAFKYSNRQNLMRLQKCLVGAAREAVVSMLIYPSEVPKIIDELQFTFGRPEHMVRYQLSKIKAIPIIPENKIDQILVYSTKVRNVVSFLKASKCERQLSDPNLLDELVVKLPTSKQFEWIKHSLDIKPYASIEHFSAWLSTLARIMGKMPPPLQSTSRLTPQVAQRRVMHATETVAREFKCCHCGLNHKLANCEQFKTDLNVEDRWTKVKANQLCFSCLNKGHSSLVCRMKKICGISGCRRYHHHSLHEEIPQSRLNAQPILNCDTPDDTGQLFKILPVTLYGPTGKIDTYVMFDEGSAISLMEEDTAVRLGLKGQHEPLKLQWYGQKVTTEESRKVSLEIEGLEENQRFNIKNVRTIKNLNLPVQSFKKSDYNYLKFLPLQEYTEARPVILLGLDYVHLSASSTVVESGQTTPIAAKTKLGWVAYGPRTTTPNPMFLHIRQRDTNLNQIVTDFIATENFGANESCPIPESTQNIKAKEIMKNTTRKIGKRYEIGLLWREFVPTLPNSFSMALKRLISIEKKMSREPEFADRYREGIRKYVDSGYARKLVEDEINNTRHAVWYLPHFAVQSPHKPNRVRIVFDAAATSHGISLNSVLSKGPEQAKPLIGILFQFRQDVIGVAADIREMFSQVRIIPEDQHAQRFLWRDGDQNKPVQQFAMVSMIFGAVCSPCCAEWIKNINAKRFEDTYPEASAAVIGKHYVDDFVCSFPNEEEAERICKQVTIINAEAGFQLRNFVSNSSKLETTMNGVAITESKKISMERQATSEKILGMFWDTTTDSFNFETKFHRIPQKVLESRRPPTKRELLGIVMAIFDPFGFLADFLIFSKILVQECWKVSIDWDDPIPTELHIKWSAWWNEFQQVKAFQISRCYSPHIRLSNNTELHVFVDASQSAFAAVGYFRIVTENRIELSFVAGKTRTAPKKLMSVPRLELQAAILGLRLSRSIIQSHEIKISKTIFWSDSRTVLYWIHSHERRYKPFVGHRISEIISNTDPNQWRWVPTSDNSADAATRPTFPPKFNCSSRWIQGPDFLKDNEQHWPAFQLEKTNIASEEEIQTKTVLCCQASRPFIQFTKYSSYFKLKRVTAWVVRFAKIKAKIDVPKGPLLVSDMAAAEQFICRIVQKEEYRLEIAALKGGKPISKSSSIYALTPYLDEKGLLRIQGRLDEALCLPYSARRPIILPQNHTVSRLIVESFHRRYHHQNVAVIINQIRQIFWMPRLKTILKDVQKECSICKIDRAAPKPPLMGQLPTDRVTPYVRPFTYTGVDLFGPLNVSIGRRREKRWVVIFTCLTIRAAHFEIAESLSTDAFIICLKNFINRRGSPVSIRCDNGTNFIGAQRELKKNECLLDTDRIIDESTKQNIEWIFNCPANPSSGGCWERLIKIVKLLFSKTLKDEAPRIETLRCALLEAENIMNSRPLTEIPLSSDQDEPLTPNHFLLGCVNSTQTPHPVDIKICLQKQWRIAQNLKDRLWKRWVVEYLPQLLRRSKWHDKPPPLKVNDLVIICDHNQPRSQWQKGRVTKVVPAKDGHIRIAEVKTANALLRRPANKLAVLTIDGES